MAKKIVIVGSVSLQKRVQYWKRFFEDMGYRVLDYPLSIAKEGFIDKYPKVHIDFFKKITQADILFVMNEDKNCIRGYIGAESFAEIFFGVAQNLIYNKNLEVVLLQIPEKRVQAYDEIVLWLKLGWIKLFNKI